MNFPKCKECGKFLKNVNALINGMEEIVKVEGECKKHGIQETDDWEYWDFFPEKEWPDSK